MAFGPSTRMTPGLRLTPRQSPHFKTPTTKSPIKSPMRDEQCLSLKQVIGTTADSSNGFDHIESQRKFAFVAGAAAILAHVDDSLNITQRFFRAKPSATPANGGAYIYDSPTPASSVTYSRGRLGSSSRESGVGLAAFDLSIGPGGGGADSPGAKGTLRDRAKAATCVSLSRDGRLLAVGESGHRPRVLVFSTSPEAPPDTPMVAVSEHTFGVRCVAFSPDAQYLASLGEVNDGFIYIWRINRTTGSVSLQASNKCTSYVRQMCWVGNSTLVTVGQRHVKIWRVNDEVPKTSPSKRFSDVNANFTSPSRTLMGRNCLLGSLLDKTFTCVLSLSDSKAIICTEEGDVCLLEDVETSPRFQKVVNCNFRVNTAVRLGASSIIVAGLDGEMKSLNIEQLIHHGRTRTPTQLTEEQSLRLSTSSAHVLAMAPLSGDCILTLDSTRHMQLLRLCLDSDSTVSSCSVARRYPAHGGSILGVQPLEPQYKEDASFLTFSAEGTILLWDSEGNCVRSLTVTVDQMPSTEDEMLNELRSVKAFHGHDLIVSGDKLGVMRIYKVATGELLYETRAHSAEIMDFSVHQSKDSTTIASAGRDRMAQVFELPGGRPQACHLTQTLDEHVGAVTGILFSKDASRLVTSSADRTIVVRESVSGELDGRITTAYVIVRTITLKATPLSMSAGPLGDEELLVSTIDRQISRYDMTSGFQTATFKATDGDGSDSVIVGAAVYLPLGLKSGCVASVSGTDKSIRVYDDNGKLLGREYGHTEGMTGLAAVSSDVEGSKKSLVTVASDSTIFIWNVTSPAEQMQELFDRLDMARTTPTAGSVFANRPPLRRVLSSQELMHLQNGREASDGLSPLSGRARSRSPRRRLSSRPSLQALPRVQLEPVTEKQPLVATTKRPVTRSSTLDSSPSPPPSSKISAAAAESSPPPLPPPAPALIPSALSPAPSETDKRLEKPASAPTPCPVPTPAPAPVPPVRRSLTRASTSESDTIASRAARGRPVSPKGKALTMPRASRATIAQPLRRKSGGGQSSTSNLNELASSTEQMCRALHAYRKGLGTSNDVLPLEAAKELERELSLTARSLADKAARSETVMTKLLDTYSERLLGLLDDKIRQSVEGQRRVESPESLESVAAAASVGGASQGHVRAS